MCHLRAVKVMSEIAIKGTLAQVKDLPWKRVGIWVNKIGEETRKSNACHMQKEQRLQQKSKQEYEGLQTMNAKSSYPTA